MRIRSDDLLWEQIDGETVVLDLRSSEYLHLNHTGTLMWDALSVGAQETVLLEVLTGCGASAEQARTDLRAFIATLEQRGLVEST